MCEPSEILSDDRGVVQGLHAGEVDCISAGHKVADLWILVWSQGGECVDEGVNSRVVWTEAHTTLEEKAKMLHGNRQVAWVTEKS